MRSAVFLVFISCYVLSSCHPHFGRDMTEGWQADKFFVAYYLKDQKPEDWDEKIKTIRKGLKEYDLQYQSWEYGSNDFNVYFPKDTFNFVHMEQFSLRNGFWFYEETKEPIDLGYDEFDQVISKAKSYFSE